MEIAVLIVLAGVLTVIGLLYFFTTNIIIGASAFGAIGLIAVFFLGLLGAVIVRGREE